ILREARHRCVADVSRRLFRSAPQSADADHARERIAIDARVGVSERPARVAEPWPTYHGYYSGQRHSPLTQITPANVSQLTLAWAFQTGQSASIKSTAIVVNGTLDVTATDQ